MSKFRKKPVVIEAFQWDPSRPVADTPNWFFEACARQEAYPEFDGTCTIRTLEDGAKGRAKHVAERGDWIIRGVKGEFYACKDEIFRMTYEPAGETP